MRKVTFEIALPVREMCPQWISFIHEVNRIAKEGGAKEAPFGAPIIETGGVERYKEATITHGKREVKREIGVLEIGIITFRAATERMASWFLAASQKYDEANVRCVGA